LQQRFTFGFFHALRRLRGFVLDRHHHAADVGCGFRRALRQLSDFVRDNGKSAPGLAGAGRFDVGVQCQQVGMFRHLIDDVGDGTNFQRTALQAADQLFDLLHRAVAAVGMIGRGPRGGCADGRAYGKFLHAINLCHERRGMLRSSIAIDSDALCFCFPSVCGQALLEHAAAFEDQDSEPGEDTAHNRIGQFPAFP